MNQGKLYHPSEAAIDFLEGNCRASEYDLKVFCCNNCTGEVFTNGTVGDCFDVIDTDLAILAGCGLIENFGTERDTQYGLTKHCFDLFFRRATT